MQVRDSLLPLVSLGELFGMPHRAPIPCQATVVVVEDDGAQVGLVVDELLGKQEVVIKSLGESFASVRGVAGGAILGDGRIGLILDAHGIVALARGGDRARRMTGRSDGGGTMNAETTTAVSAHRGPGRQVSDLRARPTRNTGCPCSRCARSSR